MSDYRPTLIVPGLHGSGDGHWQTWWQQKDRNALRVEQHDWGAPDLEVWSEPLRSAVCASRHKAWIVAHSFGCLVSLHVAREYPERIAGMFLVAPADPDKFGVAARLPQRLDVPAVFVASRTDPWLGFGKAQCWAADLDCHFVDLGQAGHINVESGHGAWQQGFDLFGRFRNAPDATDIA